MIEAIQVVTLSTSLRQVLAALDVVKVKICLVVSANGRLLRTLTDGDIRRILLAGATLETLLSMLPEPDSPPVTVAQDAVGSDVEALFAGHSVRQIVVVDEVGQPVRLVHREETTQTLLLSPPHMGRSEESYVTQAFRDNWVAPAGPNLDAFEAALAQTTGRTHALAVSSGTAALHLALRVLNVKANDIVYVSDLTFAASVQPVFYEKAKLVLIDSDPYSWNMSPEALGRRLKKDAAGGCLPKAIIVVHIYGQSADMDAICALASSYDVAVVEDATESLGATYGNLPSGGHGTMAAYSFNGNKMITTSGGGALVANSADLIARAGNLATQGRDPVEHYQHRHVAYNYRLSNVLAGIGRGQLEVLGDRVAARRAVFERYKEGLFGVPGISFQTDLPGAQGCRWLSVISLDPDQINLHPYQIMRRLRDHGIETRPAWKPMHLQPLCVDAQFEPHDSERVVSAGLFFRSLCLPSGSALAPDQQDRIITSILDLIEEA